MKRYLFAITMAMSLALGIGSASAQEEGFPFPPEAPAADPAPVNPTQMSLESGKVMVVVGSPRHFGYRIGEVIPLTIVISADQNVHINIDGITRGVLAAEGSDFELAAKPVMVKEQRGNRTVYRIQLQLRSWATTNKPTLVFTGEFLYATSLLPDGKNPHWKAATTPAFVVNTSVTAPETAKELLEGDMDGKTSQTPALAFPARITGIVLVSLLPAFLLYRLWRRVRPERYRSREELTWVNLDRIFEASAKEGTLTGDHLKQLSEVLRDYLRIPSVPLEDVAIPLEDFFAMHEDKLAMLSLATSALTKLNTAVYSKSELTAEEKAELVTEIQQIVPRD